MEGSFKIKAHLKYYFNDRMIGNEGVRRIVIKKITGESKSFQDKFQIVFRTRTLRPARIPLVVRDASSSSNPE